MPKGKGYKSDTGKIVARRAKAVRRNVKEDPSKETPRQKKNQRLMTNMATKKTSISTTKKLKSARQSARMNISEERRRKSQIKKKK